MANSFGYHIDEKRLKAGTKYMYKVFRPWKLPPYSTDTQCHEAVSLMTTHIQQQGVPIEEHAAILDGVQYFFDPEVQAGLKFASEFKKKYFAQFPGIKSFIKECSSVAASRGYIRYWSNRRRHFVNPKEDSYKAPNSLIQGGCGDIIKTKMHEVRQFLKAGGYKTRMINNVHDELTTLHPKTKDELEIILPINKILQDLPFRVPITWGIDWGFRWGEKQEFKGLDALYSDLNI